MQTGHRYRQETRERAVRMVVEHRDEHPTERAAVASITAKPGMTPEMLALQCLPHDRRHPSGVVRQARGS